MTDIPEPAPRQEGSRRPGRPGGAPRLSDIAYERLLEGLFARRITAGAFVSQNELAAQFGIPVAPLRDALRMLEADGVLNIHPRSGIQFLKPDSELTRSTYQFRDIIERAAVRAFAAGAAPDEMAALARAHRALLGAVARDGLPPPLAAEMERLEQALHGAVVASLRNPLVDRAHQRVRNILRLIRLDRRLTAPVVRQTLTEHLAILEACAARDAAGAEAAMHGHLSAALQRIFGMF